MSFVIVVFALIAIGMGLVNLFAKDVAWSMTRWQNSSRGLASERTDQWDASATLQGVVLIVIGIGVLFLIPLTQPRYTGPGGVGTTTVFIDGKPATPEEQHAVEEQIRRIPQPTQSAPALPKPAGQP